MLNSRTIIGSLGLVLVGTWLLGCGAPTPPATPPVAPTTTVVTTTSGTAGTPTGLNIPIDVQSGIAVNPPPNNTQIFSSLAQTKGFTNRSDPFALSSEEKEFNNEQLAESLVASNGNMTFMYEEPPVKVPSVEQAQPYRRLSGILVGNAVFAIIDMGDGQPPRIVSPGELIPGTDWTVVSIDDSKAVLRRPGNTLPHTIDVQLEEPPPGMGGGTTGTGGGTGGGGTPGAPPKKGSIGPKMGGVG